MAEFMFGLRRMMGLTTPEEEADQQQRAQVTGQGMRDAVVAPPERMQFAPAMNERAGAMRAAQQEMQRQNTPPPVQPPAAPQPVFKNINTQKRVLTPEDEEIRRQETQKIYGISSGVRG